MAEHFVHSFSHYNGRRIMAGFAIFMAFCSRRVSNSIYWTEQLPYYTYDLVGSNWSATFVVVDSDCFLSSYQKVIPPFTIYHALLTNTLRTLQYTATYTHQLVTTTPKLKLTSYPPRSQPQTPPGNFSSYTIRIAQSQRMKQISPL
jgi:hypothetical protein